MPHEQDSNPDIIGFPRFRGPQMCVAMDYLMNWAIPEAPSTITSLGPERTARHLKMNLYAAGHKVEDLAFDFGKGGTPHEELEFLADALKRVARGEAVEANPFTGE